MAEPAPAPLEEIETWIFDLDNTLYPASCRLFDQIGARMTEFICQRFGLESEGALSLRKSYFRHYGTTLRGLMSEDGVDPEEFLAYVHEIDLSSLAPDPGLERALSSLPGRKIVHTNASAGHASRILDRLGIAPYFSAILDIAAAGYEPKPAPAGYRELIRRHGVRPESALMIEDIARNLMPAAALGMTTVWLRGTQDWAAEGAEGHYVHHVIDDLPAFLAWAAARQAR
jgi:putative hydrolase of the HAD superfamily